MQVDRERIEKVKTQLDAQEMTGKQLCEATGLKWYEVTNVINVLTFITTLYEYDGADGVVVYGMAK